MITGILFGLLCAATWACGSIMMKGPSKKLDPFTLNAPRTLIGGVAVLILVLASGRTASYQALTWHSLFFLIGSMVIGGVLGDSLYVYSLSRIGVSRAFPIASSYPALTLLFGVIFMHEQVDAAIVAGLVLVLGGILLISRRSDEPGAMPLRGLGLAPVLLASLFWAVSMVMVAPGLKGLDELMVASVRLPALSLMLWSVSAARGGWRGLLKLTRQEWVLISLGGLIGWGLGSVFFLLAVSHLGPTRASILTSTSPLFALPLSVAFLKERVNWMILGGTALTVLGIVLVS